MPLARAWRHAAPPAADALAVPVPVLRLPRRRGRLRGGRHLLMLAAAAAGGATLFGLAGAVPLALWWWLQRPGPSAEPEWEVDLARLRRARLGTWRTCVTVAGAPPLEIFHDEIDPADLAWLRREVKARLAG